jgi:hypothetical protein
MEKTAMRRLSIVAVAILAIGCSSHSGTMPAPAKVSVAPNIFQKQPLPHNGFEMTEIPPVESGKYTETFGLALDNSANFWILGLTTRMASHSSASSR